MIRDIDGRRTGIVIELLNCFENLCFVEPNWNKQLFRFKKKFFPFRKKLKECNNKYLANCLFVTTYRIQLWWILQHPHRALRLCGIESHSTQGKDTSPWYAPWFWSKKNRNNYRGPELLRWFFLCRSRGKLPGPWFRSPRSRHPAWRCCRCRNRSHKFYSWRNIDTFEIRTICKGVVANSFEVTVILKDHLFETWF